jgi:ABC-type nitrate/sulfonate/bicarbonate transport system ATPase subunit
MGSIALAGIVKRYADTVAVDIPDLVIDEGEFVVLLGPSGCGKTTTLRLIAGLETPSSGEILMDGMVVNSLSPKERNVAMVFQDYALYPHMRVYDNIALNLRVDKIPKPEIDRRVHDVARLLNIEHLLERRPRAMSGGQQQRVALGRAIVRNPAYFLMDEPLSNLDAKLRLAMRSEIRRLHDRIGATTAYGLSRWQMYWLIALPMSVPTVNTVAILQTVYIWNEFLFCLVLVRSPERFTMPRALMTFKGTFITAFGPLNAAVILSAVPTIIIYFVFADRIRRGMSMGFSAKG